MCIYPLGEEPADEQLEGCFNHEQFYELEISVHGQVSACVPARISGPPEDCYPAEGGEVDDVSFECEDHGLSHEQLVFWMGPSDHDKAARLLQEEAESGEPDGFDPPDDY